MKREIAHLFISWNDPVVSNDTFAQAKWKVFESLPYFHLVYKYIWWISNFQHNRESHEYILMFHHTTRKSLNRSERVPFKVQPGNISKTFRKNIKCSAQVSVMSKMTSIVVERCLSRQNVIKFPDYAIMMSFQFKSSS